VYVPVYRPGEDLSVEPGGRVASAQDAAERVVELRQQ
jgi:hypothetical protein